jgi:hypothetical protein
MDYRRSSASFVLEELASHESRRIAAVANDGEI